VVAIILLGKLTAYARDATLSAFYGASAETDALFVANNVPNLVFSAFFATIGIVFLPVYNQVRSEDGLAAAEEFGRNVITVYLVLSLVLSAACFVFAGSLVRFMAPAFPPATHALSTELARIVSWSFAFTSVTGILCSIQYAAKRYVGPQLMPSVNNVITAVAVILLASRFGIYVAAVAATLAWVIQVPIQSALVRSTFRYRPRIKLGDKALRKMSLMLIPVLISVSMEQVYVLIDNILGSTLTAGSISGLNYSQRLLNVATGTFVLAVTTVMFPQFSEYVVEAKTESLYAAIDRSVGALALVLAPITVLVLAFRREIVSLAFQRGAFGGAATALTATLLGWYALGVLFTGVRDTLNRVHYAMQDTKTPLFLTALAMIVKVALSVILLRYMAAAGLALATSLATAVYCAIQFVVLRRRLGAAFHSRLPKVLSQVFVGLAAMTVVIVGYTAVVPRSGVLLRLILPALLASGSYLFVLIVLKVEEVDLAWAAIAHMIRPRGGTNEAL